MDITFICMVGKCVDMHCMHLVKRINRHGHSTPTSWPPSPTLGIFIMLPWPLFHSLGQQQFVMLSLCVKCVCVCVSVCSNCSKWLRGSSKKIWGGMVLVHSCWPTCNAISAAGQSPSAGTSPWLVLFLDDIFTYHPFHPPSYTHICTNVRPSWQSFFRDGSQHIWSNFFISRADRAFMQLKIIFHHEFLKKIL